ncbi:MAG: Hpt domain-containing protein, partial [Bdellovibrionales bacterium]|nr:Hpt domain-containing protein [Bdellovibrionales bacterium]
MNRQEELTEELALLVVLLDAQDSSSIEMFASSLSSLMLDAQTAGLDDVATAAQALLSLTQDPASFIQSAEQFVQQLQSGNIDSTSSMTTAQKGAAQSGGWQQDLDESLDLELTVEFIEKHRSLLNELEAYLLAPDNSAYEDPDGAKAYVKGYLHNIKGDAGAVGLLGVQNVTHHVEDVVLENELASCTEILLTYKEWVFQVMDAFAANEVPRELSNDILRRLSIQEERSVDQLKHGEEVAQKGFVSEQYSITGDLDILNEFIVEAQEHLNA